MSRLVTAQRPVPSEPVAAPTVLGIDPGLQRTGYAVLKNSRSGPEARVLEAGVIRLTRGRSLADRLCELDEALDALITAHRPALLVCEELYAHYKHPRTAILMAHARGVILFRAAHAKLRILPVSATNVKKLLTGSGRASKRQVQLAVAATLNLPQVPEPNDVADAIAIGLAGLRMQHNDDVAGQPRQRRAQA